MAKDPPEQEVANFFATLLESEGLDEFNVAARRVLFTTKEGSMLGFEIQIEVSESDMARVMGRSFAPITVNG